MRQNKLKKLKPRGFCSGHLAVCPQLKPGRNLAAVDGVDLVLGVPKSLRSSEYGEIYTSMTYQKKTNFGAISFVAKLEEADFLMWAVMAIGDKPELFKSTKTRLRL